MTFDTNGPNGWPPNMEPAAETDFWEHILHYGYGEIEIRFPLVGRALRESDPTWPDRPGAVWVHTYEDGTGFVVALIQRDYGKPSPDFFTFAACRHDYAITKERLCLTERTCQDCGYVSVVDSSG